MNFDREFWICALWQIFRSKASLKTSSLTDFKSVFIFVSLIVCLLLYLSDRLFGCAHIYFATKDNLCLFFLFFLPVWLIVPWPLTNIMTPNVGFTLAKGRPSTPSLLSNYVPAVARPGPGVPVVGDPRRHRAPPTTHRQVGSRCWTMT